jgi:hypothetical protein
MGESFKAVCALVLVVAALIAAVAWSDDQPNSTTWIARGVASFVAVLALVVLLKVHFRADLVPDYLWAAAGKYFNRDGFCFALNATVVDGVGYLVVSFQNQYDRQCRGQIGIRPARGFWMTRSEIQTIALEIDCAPAGFGVARVAIPLIREVQGKKQTFEVGASVEYSRGARRRLRFRDGVFLRANSEFGNAFATAIFVTGALCGRVILTSPATTTFMLPNGAAQELSGVDRPEVETLWKLGDSPLAETTDERQEMEPS